MSGASHTTVRILIVDDNATTRSKLFCLLNEVNDFRIDQTVRNGHEGVAVALRTRPDVIILNNSTPFIDGIEATQYMHSRLPHTPIIMLASDDLPDQVEAALDAGVMGYFSKPICNAEHFTESLRLMATCNRQTSRR